MDPHRLLNAHAKAPLEMHLCLVFLLTTLTWLAAAFPAVAALPVPEGLGVGDTYQLAFSTRATTSATNHNIGFYNTFVQTAANNAGIGSGLGIGWTAIASTSSIDARDNAVVGANTPVYNLRADGPEKVADGFADMWDGSLDAPLLYDEHGERNVIVVGGDREFLVDAWTGTEANGLRAANLTLGGSAEQAAWCGRVSLTDGRWMQILRPGLTTELSLYALSEVLTVTDADFNGDDRVSGVDFLTWQRGKGGSGGFAAGDANGDNAIDGDDLRIWESSFGSSATSAVASNVPEPTSLLLAAACLVLTTSGRIARRRLGRRVRP